MDAFAMMLVCFKHQHPEAFGGAPVPRARISLELRYGQGEGEDCHNTPMVFDAPSDKGVEGHYPLPDVPKR